VTQKGTLRGVAINLRQLSAKAQAMSNDDGFDAAMPLRWLTSPAWSTAWRAKAARSVRMAGTNPSRPCVPAFGI
jgi:hypothetical protein